MPNIEDLIDSGLDQQPTKFASVFNDIMGQKALEALDSMRTGIAQSIYAGEEEDLEPEDQEDDLDSDIDDDEFDDIDDLDLEDEDLQFDDSDLEGLDDDGEDA